MGEIAAFINGFYGPCKRTRKVSTKPRAKPIKVGSRVQLSIMSNMVCIVVSQDPRNKSWILKHENGTPIPYSYSRDMLKVL